MKWFGVGLIMVVCGTYLWFQKLGLDRDEEGGIGCVAELLFYLGWIVILGGLLW